MKSSWRLKSLIPLIVSLFYSSSAQDSLYFESSTGNYIIQYVGETLEGRDTTVRVVFEPATKIIPNISCSFLVLLDKDASEYSYKISNGNGAIQTVSRFMIEFGDVSVVTKPNNHGWRDARQRELEADSLLVLNRWAWSGTGDKGLSPGAIKEGFVLKSDGIAGIVNAYFRGRTAILKSPAGGPGPDLAKKIAALRIFPADHVVRKTLGPVKLPTTVTSFFFLDTLLSYTRQSSELGWLGRDRDNDCDNDEKPEVGIVRNIEQRLKKAKRQLERRDSVLARRELEKLVSKVERLWKRSQDDEERKHGRDRKNWWRRDKGDRIVMTSEAYALLKYNTEYLIDRLLDESSRRPDRKPKKGSKDQD